MLIADDTGYVEDVKPGLPGERSESRWQGLRRDVRAQRGRVQDLRTSSHRPQHERRTDCERAEQSDCEGRELRR